jgi:hypothetical protein
MNRLKKILRTIGLILLIILALSGIGIMGGPLLPKNRQDYDEKEIGIELVEGQREDSEVKT